jgi:hypothetical protein
LRNAARQGGAFSHKHAVFVRFDMHAKFHAGKLTALGFFASGIPRSGDSAERRVIEKLG